MRSSATVRRYTFRLSHGTNVYSSYAFAPTKIQLCRTLNMTFPLETSRHITRRVASALLDCTGHDTRIGTRGPQDHCTDGWHCTYIGFERSYPGITGGIRILAASRGRARGAVKSETSFSARYREQQREDLPSRRAMPSPRCATTDGARACWSGYVVIHSYGCDATYAATHA